MSDNNLNVAVVGAADVVGEAILAILSERDFPVSDIYALDDEASAGKRVEFGDKMIKVADQAEFDFSQVDLAIFAIDAARAAQLVPEATSAGAISIDTSSAFRYETDVPLVVPGVNDQHIAEYTNRGIIASPNPTSVALALALKPICDTADLERVEVSTYQSVAGSGKRAIEGLAYETAALMNGKSVKPSYYPKQIAFNVLGLVGDITENGYSTEEMELKKDIDKLYAGVSRFSFNPTAVRVPIFYGTGESVSIQAKSEIRAITARNLWEKSPDIEVVDGSGESVYPTPITDSASSDKVFVGRVRQDIDRASGLSFWLVSDNVRRGAGLNSVQIAEILVKNYL